MQEIRRRCNQTRALTTGSDHCSNAIAKSLPLGRPPGGRRPAPVPDPAGSPAADTTGRRRVRDRPHPRLLFGPLGKVADTAGRDHPRNARQRTRQARRPGGVRPPRAQRCEGAQLEGFLGFVRDRHYEEIVMPLANVTNLAFDLEPALAALDIRMRLIIADDPPLPAPTRQAMFEEIAPLVQLAGSGKVAVAMQALRAATDARRQGRRTLLVMPSPGIRPP